MRCVHVKIYNAFINMKWDIFVLLMVMEKAAVLGDTGKLSFWGSSSQFRTQQNRAKEQ